MMRVHKFHELRKRLLGMVAAFLLPGASAHAAVQTITHGESLVVSCRQALSALDHGLHSLADAQQNDAFVCMAYLGGLMAGTQHANELAKLRYSLATDGRGKQRQFKLYCFDGQVPYAKMARIVLDFARRNPGYLQRPAGELALRALQTAFPCR